MFILIKVLFLSADSFGSALLVRLEDGGGEDDLFQKFGEYN